MFDCPSSPQAYVQHIRSGLKFKIGYVPPEIRLVRYCTTTGYDYNFPCRDSQDSFALVLAEVSAVNFSARGASSLGT